MLVLGAVQVDAPERHLAGGAHERQRTSAGEVEGLQQRRRGPGEFRRRGQIAQRARGAVPADRPPAERGEQSTLDRRGALVLDQLLADRPGERLEGLGAPRSRAATAGAGPNGRSAGRARTAKEGTQVLVDAQREAHARDPVCGRRARAARAPEQDPVGRGLRGAHEHGLVFVVQQALEHAAAPAQDPSMPPPRQAKRPRRRISMRCSTGYSGRPRQR